MPNTGKEDLVSCAFGGHATAGRMQKDSVEVPRLAVTLQCVGPVSLVNKASVLVFACSLPRCRQDLSHTTMALEIETG